MQPSMLLRRVFSTITLVLVALVISTPRGALAAPNAGVQDTIKAALNKTAAATTYRLEMDMTVSGEMAKVIGQMTNSVPSAAEASVMNIVAETSGKDSHVTLKGFIVSMLGLDPTRGIESINVGGKTYLRGPLPSLGAPEDRWYVIEQPQTELMVDSTPEIDSLAQTNLAGLRLMSTETLDGRRCEVYGSNDKNAVFGALGTLSRDTPDADTFDKVEKAELKLWICDDGYLHQLRVSVEGSDKMNPQDKMGFGLRLHLFDFNGTIKITAPANAAPLDTSNLGGVFMTLPSESQPVTAPAAGALTATVANGGNIRQAPNLKGKVLGQLHAHQVITLHEKNLNGSWYLVEAPEATGWVSVSLLKIDPAIAGQVRAGGQSTLATQPSTVLTATVAHGGNRRAAPNVQAKVLGLVEVGETVQLLSKTRDGVWYEVRCRCGAMGWVHSSLLKIEPAVARQVPVV